MKKRSITILAVVWLVAIVAVASSVITMNVTGTAQASNKAYTVTQEEYEMIQRYSRLETVRQYLTDYYYQDVDQQTLLDGACDGMMESLNDPYTFYYTPEEMTASTEEANGVYNGIGMMVQQTDDGKIKVLRVFKDSPALEAGLLKGDIIYEVDGTTVGADTQMDMSAAIKLIKSGEIGTEVVLSIQRGEEKLQISVKRAQVRVNRVEYQMLENNIGYLALYNWEGDAVSGFKEALNYFTEQGADGIVVDVRDNPGGYLDIVLDISDMVLPQGLIVYTEDRYGKRDDYYADAVYNDIPMVVLANEGSASASEIFCAALQDYGRAKIVGTTTFGKGIVQSVITFNDDGAGLQLTTSSYYTPNGRSIHKIGVTPDVEVELDEDYNASLYTVDPENDNQLKTAIETLMTELGK